MDRQKIQIQNVSESVINGQWKQAAEQFLEYDFDAYETKRLEISDDDKIKLLGTVIMILKNETWDMKQEINYLNK
jgi:hypothetical protein